MIDKELIGIWKNMLKPAISSWLLKTNYEGLGEQDKEEFERDFDEILDLALVGLKYKAQLSQERTDKRTESHACDLISRQAAKLKVARVVWEDGDSCYDFNDKCVDCLDDVQPEEAIPVSWIESIIERFMMAGDAFSGLTASIIRVMLNVWKREQGDKE